MDRARFLLFFFVTLLFFISGCSTAPKPGEFSSEELMEAACPASFASFDRPKVVRGSVWTKISSKEMSGRFPATVLVEYPKKLAVEVTNLIGAPQAWLKIEDGKTELRFTTENEQKFGRPETRTMLGGLPLALAPRLFAGGVPCPSHDKNQDRRVRQTETGELEVIELDLRTRQQIRYLYSFSRYEGRPWVNEVIWEMLAKNGKRGAKSLQIKIVREEPSPEDGAPVRWSASSDEGDIQVRWKDRSPESQ